MNLVVQQQQSWQAKLELRFEKTRGQSTLVYQAHAGPLRVQKQFSQPDGSCHIYILHPPGGLVAGDSLEINITAAADTQVLVTSPSAGRAYRCVKGAGTQLVRQAVQVAEGAHLEWLPQETIFYQGASAEVSHQVSLASGATYLGWEIQSLGRRASGEDFSTGQLVQRSAIWRGGQRCHREQLRVTLPLQASPWGLSGASVLGTLVAVPGIDKLPAADLAVSLLQSLLPGRYWGATLRDCTVLVRYLGDSAEACREGFARARRVLTDHELFNGSTAGIEPRIWKT